MTVRFRPPIHHQRVAMAKRRIRTVMRRRLVAYSRELERQVCEVGFNFATTPQSERPEPVHFSEALRTLTRTAEPDDEEAKGAEPEIIVLPHIARIPGHPHVFARFYAYRDADRESVQRAFDQKVAAVGAYLRVEQIPKFAGWHAEGVALGRRLAAGARSRPPPGPGRAPRGGCLQSPRAAARSDAQV